VNVQRWNTLLEEKVMQTKPYSTAAPTFFDSEVAKGIAARVVIGKDDGAPNFYMRVFEIASGGNTPLHTHAWEHEMFIHAGAGEVFGNGRWNPVQAGNVVFIPGDEEHQIRNPNQELLVGVCLVPAFAPEL
jgi:quercetin dioxygenase-like cupin family protein